MEAISSGSPARPMGVRERMDRRAASSVQTAFRVSSVSTVPGPIPQTRMPCGASVMAAFLVNWFRPSLETL